MLSAATKTENLHARENHLTPPPDSVDRLAAKVMFIYQCLIEGWTVRRLGSNKFEFTKETSASGVISAEIDLKVSDLI
jgi:hypothetical protein